LHLLLAAADFLVAWPLVAQLAALVVIAGHAIVRRPEPTPSPIIVAADATWLIPRWCSHRAPLGRRTLVCSYWINLDLGMGPPRRDIVLFIDQLDGRQWAQLCALLHRARCDTVHVSQRPGEPI
jgi:hypothetical protein